MSLTPGEALAALDEGRPAAAVLEARIAALEAKVARLSQPESDADLIARLERVFPELVQTDATGRKSADYQRLTAPIIEALRELKADNDSLKVEVEAMKRRMP